MTFEHRIRFSTDALSIRVKYETAGNRQYQPDTVTIFRLPVASPAYNCDALSVGETATHKACAAKILRKLDDRRKTLGMLSRDTDMRRSDTAGIPASSPAASNSASPSPVHWRWSRSVR
jgi:hypothetical protein